MDPSSKHRPIGTCIIYYGPANECTIKLNHIQLNVRASLLLSTFVTDWVPQQCFNVIDGLQLHV